eukprot:751540_1
MALCVAFSITWIVFSQANPSTHQPSIVVNHHANHASKFSLHLDANVTNDNVVGTCSTNNDFNTPPSIPKHAFDFVPCAWQTYFDSSTRQCPSLFIIPSTLIIITSTKETRDERNALSVQKDIETSDLFHRSKTALALVPVRNASTVDTLFTNHTQQIYPKYIAKRVESQINEDIRAFANHCTNPPYSLPSVPNTSAYTFGACSDCHAALGTLECTLSSVFILTTCMRADRIGLFIELFIGSKTLLLVTIALSVHTIWLFIKSLIKNKTIALSLRTTPLFITPFIEIKACLLVLVVSRFSTNSTLSIYASEYYTC